MAVIAAGRKKLGNRLATLSVRAILGVIPSGPGRRTRQHLGAAWAGWVFAAENHFAGRAMAGLVLHFGSWLVSPRGGIASDTFNLCPDRLATSIDRLGITPISRPTLPH